MSLIRARFDDVWNNGRPLSFADPSEVIVARSAEEVLPAISTAEEAAGSGSWVAGFIAYEAASGVHPRLVTVDPDPDLPLVWFAVFPEAVQAPVQEGGTYTLSPWEAETTPGEYRRAVTRVRELIRSGDTYQVNFTTRLRSKMERRSGRSLRRPLSGAAGQLRDLHRHWRQRGGVSQP